MKKGLKEGSPEHAALHAIVGCAGAAASNQGCSSGALGGAASSVLAGLFAEADANETAVEREAKRNLITSLVTGIAAVSDPNGAATANNAATANIDNNWLSTQQFVQAKKELEEAQGTLAKAIVTAKWFGTSVRQDALTAGGIGLGIAESGLQDIRGLAEFLSDPLTGLQGIASVVSSSEVRAQLGEEVTASLLGSIDRMKLALEVGGDDHAVQLGRDLGALIYTVGGVLTAVGGAAKAGLSLAKTGVEVSSKALGKMVAKDSEELGVRVAALETRTTKSLDTVTEGQGPGAKGPTTGSPSGETKVVGDGKPAANDGSFAGEKGPATGSPSGETKVVGDGGPAANDASFIGAKDLTPDLSEVWTLKPTQRGVEIESYLARTEYSPQSGWYNVGAERNGYFPLVDFQNGNTLVSLKSVDTAGSTWLGRMQDHIIDLGTNGAKVDGMPANMVLDLRVQPGGSTAAQSLIEFGREYNVKVIVKEFK